MKTLFCQNCGMNNHKKKDCPLPIISSGIICTKIDRRIKIKSINDYVKIDRVNSNNMSNIAKINKYKNRIKFLLVRRKHTISYVEFIRGKYKINKEELTKKFKLMSPDEIVNIGSLNFKKLWENLWQDTSWRKSFEKEYKNSEAKFHKLKEYDDGKLFDYFTKEFIPDYTEPEWGFPKGKREYLENNLSCAIREFNEETYIDTEDIEIYNKVAPINENFVGTNGLNYRYILYLANYIGPNKKLSIENNVEIGDIGWFTLDEIQNIIRDYHQERIKIVEKVYMFLLNLIC